MLLSITSAIAASTEYPMLLVDSIRIEYASTTYGTVLQPYPLNKEWT